MNESGSNAVKQTPLAHKGVPPAQWWEERKQRVLHKYPALEPYFIPVRLQNTSVPFLPLGVLRCQAPYLSESPVAAEFWSSGSTGQKRSRHLFSAEGLRHYGAASALGWKRFLQRFHWPENETTLLSFVPTRAQWPNSSLAAMVELIQKEGVHVEYLPLEPDSQAEWVETLQRSPKNVALLGTSFHHIQSEPLWLAPQVQALLREKNILVVDTGGTKGRTRSLNPGELQSRWDVFFQGAGSWTVGSEYGMCELASQAWSLDAPHSGRFLANETLCPFVLNGDLNAVVPDGETGFLAFVDKGNLDSWPALITEDLAYALPGTPGGFALKGRAPDAALKGCSLNVAAGFSDVSVSHTLRLEEVPFGQRAEEKHFLEDLPKGLARPTSLLGPLLHIVAASNTPISWVHPTLHAAEMGFSGVCVHCPSLRPEDPFVADVRGKMLSLGRQLEGLLGTQFLQWDMERLFPAQLKNAAVLAFGQDSTLDLLKQACEQSSTPFHGCGDVRNGAQLQMETTPEQAALWALAWQGRGCLTPLYLQCPQAWFDSGFDFPEWKTQWIQEMGRLLKECVGPKGIPLEHFHAHTRALAHAHCKIHGGVTSGVPGVVVLDWTALDRNAARLAMGAWNWTLCGQGAIALVAEAQSAAIPEGFSQWPLFPTWQDPHCGEDWRQVLQGLLGQ